VVLLKDVLEHVLNDQELLNAAAGVSAPGGRMVLSALNALSLNYVIEGTFHRLFRREKKWCGGTRLMCVSTHPAVCATSSKMPV